MHYNRLLMFSLYIAVLSKVTLAIGAQPAISGEGGLLFEATPGIEKWGKINRHTQEVLKWKQRGDALEISKKVKDYKWSGITTPSLDVKHLRGLTLTASFDAKVNQVQSNGTKSFHCFVAAINFYKGTKRVSRQDILFTKRTETWSTHKLETIVPEDADFARMDFSFGMATGNVLVRNIKVYHAVFAVENKYSKSFKSSLIVQKTESPEAAESILTIDSRSKSPIVNRVNFNKAGLEFNIAVPDDKFFQVYDKDNIWKGDSIQMAFDPEFDRTATTGCDDYDIGFAFVNNKPFIYPFKTYDEKAFDGYRISFDFSRLPDRQTYKIKIPWGVIQPLNYANISTIGYSFAVNDNDGKGRCAYEWSSGIVAGKNPSRYGVLIFDKNGLGIGAELIMQKAGLDFYSGETVNFSLMVPSLSKTLNSLLCHIIIKGKNKLEYHKRFELKKGENRFDFSFSANELAEGNNKLSVSLKASPGNIQLLEKQIEIKCASLNKLKSKIDALQKNIVRNMTEIKSRLESYADKSKKPRAVYVSLGVAEVFLPCIAVDMRNKRYDLAFKEANDTNMILEKALLKLRNGDFTPGTARSVTPVHIVNGAFYNIHNKPVFLFGAYGPQSIPVLKHLNFNTMRLGWPAINNLFNSPTLQLGKQGRRRLEIMIRSAQKAAENNIICSADPNSPVEKRIPDFFKRNNPEALAAGNHFLALDPDHPESISLLDRYVQAVSGNIRKAGAEKNLFCIDMQREPGFSSITPYTLKNFRAFLKKRYSSIDLMNKYWKSSFKTFADIESVQTYFSNSKVAYYDWCIFNNKRFSSHFARMANIINPDNCREKIPLSITLINGMHWRDRASYNTGYDREQLMKTTSINGCDTRIYPEPDEDFALEWMNQSMCYDFQRSLAPEQPIFDAEWHSIQSLSHIYTDISPQYVRCALRLATWHGLSACHIWSFIFRRLEGNGQYLQGHLHTKPLALEAFARESIKIEENMEKILPFYNKPRRVGIYYSLPSAIFDGEEYLNVLKDSYKAFYFNDANLAFVTENMLLSGNVPAKGIKLLIFPNARYCSPEILKAVEALQENGVSILFIGRENLSRNTFNEKNIFKPIKSTVWPIASNWKEYSAKSSQIVKKAGAAEEYQVNILDHNRVKSVEARFAHFDNKDMGYAVNLGKTSITFEVTSTRTGRAVWLTNMANGVKTSVTKVTLAPMGYISFYIIP